MSLAVVAVLLATLVAWPAVARAAAGPTKLVMETPTALKVSEADPQAAMVIGAVLTGADGKGISNQRIEFLMATDLLGQTKASVGKAVTDSSGTARTTFVVERTGSYELSARFSGSEAWEKSVAAAQKYEFKALDTAGAEHGLQLNRIGRWVPWAGLGLGVLVWITLIYVMGSVFLVVPRAARRDLRH